MSTLFFRGSLGSELSGPFSCGGFVAGSIGLVHVSDLGNQWIIWVGVCEHRADGQENCLGLASVHEHGNCMLAFGDGEGGAPLVSEDV